jgi:hypothetical protein
VCVFSSCEEKLSTNMSVYVSAYSNASVYSLVAAEMELL